MDLVKDRDEKIKGLAVAAAVLLFLAGIFYIYSAANTLSFIKATYDYNSFRQIYIRSAIFSFAYSACYITLGILALIPAKKKAAAIIALCPAFLQLLVLVINIGNAAAYSGSIGGLTLNIFGSLLSFSAVFLPPLFLALYFLNAFKRPKSIFFIFPGAIGLNIIFSIINIFSYSEPSIRVSLFTGSFLPAVIILTGYMLFFLSCAYPRMKKAQLASPLMSAGDAWDQNLPQCYMPQHQAPHTQIPQSQAYQNENAARAEEKAALLRKLYDLKNAGIISEAEFEEKRRALGKINL